MSQIFRKWCAQKRDVWMYLIFGVLTTLLNYGIYLLFCHLTDFPASVCNLFAWLAAVIFAFVTNKLFVFRSKDWSRTAVAPEFVKFVGCRLFSGFLETGIIFVAVDLLHCYGNIIKIFTGVFVVVLNYIGSKLIVFMKQKS